MPRSHRPSLRIRHAVLPLALTGALVGGPPAAATAKKRDRPTAATKARSHGKPPAAASRAAATRGRKFR